MTLRDPAASAPTAPAASFVDPDLLATLTEAKAADTLETAAHADVLAQAGGSGWFDSLEGGEILRDASGKARSDAGEVRIDLGSPAAQAAAVALPIQLAGLDFDGVLLADVGQGRGETSYDPSDGDRTHLPHGGRYQIQGLRAIADAARPAGGHVLTAAAPEGLLGVVDLAEESVDGVFPVLAELLEVTRDGATTAEPTTRHPSPPLLSIVHGERTMAGRLIMPFSHAARDTSAFHPAPNRPEQVGLTQLQLSRCLALQIAACVVAGYLPIPATEATLHAWRMRPGDDDPALPMFGHALRALTDSTWCGDFLRAIAGMPFIVDTAATGTRAVADNPLVDLRLVNRAIWDRVGIPGLPAWSDGGDAGDDAGDDADTTTVTATTGLPALFQAFKIPRVLAGVWRKRGDSPDVCLVLANWTDTAATWSGMFVPSEQGWPVGQAGDDAGDDAAGATYRVDRLIGGESDAGDDAGDDAGNTTDLLVPIISGLSGPVVFDCSGTAGTRTGETVFLGTVPPFFIQAYRFQQE